VHTRHRWLLIVATLSALLLSLTFTQPSSAKGTSSTHAAQAATTCDQNGGYACQGTYYGADIVSMRTATNAWPQAYDNWCGIAGVQAVMRYAWGTQYGNWYPLNWAQGSIHDQMNGQLGNNPVSRWGTPGGSSYVQANLSQDFGTDPRAVAWATWLVTPDNTFYHNYIYRNGASGATHNIGLDFGPTHGVNRPIVVMINTGLHAFVVSGVYAASDPSVSTNVQIYGVYTWDPFVGRGPSINSEMEVVWSMWDWTNKSDLWGTGYGNASDPEPSTPINYYNPPFPTQSHHWNTYRTSIEQDWVRVCSTVLPDYAVDENGYPAAHNGTC
jgi:hypothetical protein